MKNLDIWFYIYVAIAGINLNAAIENALNQQLFLFVWDSACAILMIVLSVKMFQRRNDPK